VKLLHTTLQRWAWCGGLAALVATCTEDLAASYVRWLPHLSLGAHIDLISLSFLLVMWGGLSEFKAKAIAPVQQAMEYGWQLRGEEEQRRREWEAEILNLPTVLRATSGGFPIVQPRVPPAREAKHRDSRRRPARNR